MKLNSELIIHHTQKCIKLLTQRVREIQQEYT